MRPADWRVACLGACVCCALAAGCAAWKPPRPPVENVAPQREQRRADVADDMQQRRDRAEYLSAKFQWQQGDMTSCHDTLSSLLERNPRHRDGCLLWAELCLHQGRPAEALPLIEPLAAEQPDDGEVKVALARLRDGPSTVRPASHTDVEQARQRDRADNNDSGDIAALVGNADPKSANAAAQQVLIEATAALRENETTRAVTLLCRARELAPQRADVHCLLGLALYRSGDYEEARAALEQSLSLDNAGGLAYFLMGSTLARLGEDAAARRYFRQAAELDSRFVAPR